MDAIVVLGCRVAADGSLLPAAARRVERAAASFRDGAAELLVLSGGRRWGRFSEAEAYRHALRAKGIPDSAMWLELCSLTTRENAYYSARMLAAEGRLDVGLVTCDWHLPRARGHFQRAGLRPSGLPAPSRDASGTERLRRLGLELARRAFP